MTRIHFSVILTATVILITGCEKQESPVETYQGNNPVTMTKSSDVWTSLASVTGLTGPGIEGVSAANVGDKIVAACGYDGSDKNTTRIYDIATNTWSFGANAPGTNSEPPAVSKDGYVYVLGGRGSGANANWRYDLANDSWTTLAPLPTNRIGSAAAVVGNAIYVIGGRTGSAPNGFGKLSVVEKYDIGTNTWSTVSPLPYALSDCAGAVVGGKIYIFGGFNAASMVQSAVLRYDPVTDTWTTGYSSMPTARGAMYAVGTSGGTVYVIGGTGQAWSAAIGSTVEAYKVSTDTWTTGYTPMPTPRAEHCAASHGGRIYIIGGAQPGAGVGRQSANESYKP